MMVVIIVRKSKLSLQFLIERKKWWNLAHNKTKYKCLFEKGMFIGQDK